MIKFEPKAGAILAMQPEALDVSYGKYSRHSVQIDQGIGVVVVAGPLSHHDGHGCDSYDEIVFRIETAISHEDCKAVVICFDSPGGDASGVGEAHQKVKALRKSAGKPIYAYSNETMSSAAYELGCACDEIWLPRTGSVGSIGCIRAVEDRTEQNKKAGLKRELITSGDRKGDFNPDKELTDDVRARAQEQVNFFADEFFGVVANSRSLSRRSVESLEAGVFYGKDAVKVGLADGVAGWDEFFGMLLELHGTPKPTRNRLSSRDKSGTSSPTNMEMRLMSTLLSQTQEKKTLLAQLSASTSDEEKIELAAKLTSLSGIDAKTMKHTKTVEKHEESDDEDKDDEDKDDDSDEDDEPEEESKDCEEEDEEDEEASAKALLAHSGRKAKALYARVKSLTGKSSMGEVFGAIDAMAERLASVDRTERRVAKLEQSTRRAKIDGLLSSAKKDGRVTPAQMKSLGEQGMKDPKWLRGYLSTLPKRVRQSEEAVVQGLAASAAPSISDQLAAMNGNMGAMSDHQKILHVATMGLSPAQKASYENTAITAAAKANAKFGTGSGNQF